MKIKVKLTNTEKDVLTDGFILSLLLYGIFSTLFLCGGFIDSAHSSCEAPYSRGVYLFPAYRIGCWLGEKP